MHEVLVSSFTLAMRVLSILFEATGQHAASLCADDVELVSKLALTCLCSYDVLVRRNRLYELAKL